MRNTIAALMGALIAAQGSLIAKWPDDGKDWTLFGLSVLIGLCGGLAGKGVNARVKKAQAGKP